MMNKKIGICQNLDMWNHEGGSTESYIRYCIDNNLDYEVIDPYANNSIEKFKECGYVLWNIQNYLWADLLEARNLLLSVERLGVKVFPNHNTNWHFDDKIAEMYAFKSINAPIPQSWVFYSLDSTTTFLNEAKYPLVAKLRNGSGASNVKLLKSKSQAMRYAKRMFGKGFDPSPSLLYKAYSKAQSSYSWDTFISRVKKIPQFLYTRSRAKMMPIEKGYCYFQEFIENDGYDIKVVVIGDKLSFLARNVRSGDFRASGGGDFYYDKSLVTKNIIESAFQTADKLGLQCVGFDYVVNKSTGQGLIIEMCYGFDFAVIYDANGYFTRNGEWINTPVSIPNEIVANIMK
ncbi:MAG: hypothetical protein R3Y68_03090 [Rikenellaceae bacterium]